MYRTTPTLYITPTQKTWLAKSSRKNKFPETIRHSLSLSVQLLSCAKQQPECTITRHWNSTRGYLAVRETSDFAGKGKGEGSRGGKEKGHL